MAESKSDWVDFKSVKSAVSMEMALGYYGIELSTTLSFSQEVACSADLQLHAPHWLEANKLHGNRLSHANREDGLCEDILVDKVVLI